MKTEKAFEIVKSTLEKAVENKKILQKLQPKVNQIHRLNYILSPNSVPSGLKGGKRIHLIPVIKPNNMEKVVKKRQQSRRRESLEHVRSEMGITKEELFQDLMKPFGVDKIKIFKKLHFKATFTGKESKSFRLHVGHTL